MLWRRYPLRDVTIVRIPCGLLLYLCLRLQDDVLFLEAAGVLRMKRGDFGEVGVALDLGQCYWRSRMKVADARLVLTLPCDPATKNKTDLVLQLIREGWKGLPGLDLPPLQSDSPRAFSYPMLFRSRSYFTCLCDIDELFLKGLQKFWHNEPHNYYAALLALSDLSNFPSGSDLLSMTNADFKALMDGASGRPSSSELLPLQDADHDYMEAQALAEGSASEGEEGAAVVVARPPPMRLSDVVGVRSAGVDRLAAATASIVVEAFQQTFTVRFDGFSHASRIQRAYIRCAAHCACFRYAQVTSHPTRRGLAAYLVAWATLGPALSRESHQSRSLVVPEALVADIDNAMPRES